MSRLVAREWNIVMGVWKMGVVLHFYCFAFNRRRHRHLQLRKRVMKSWELFCTDGFCKKGP